MNSRGRTKGHLCALLTSNGHVAVREDLPEPDRTRRDTAEWAVEHNPDIEQSQKAYDSRNH
jgi:hypothetical protein